MPLTCTVKDTLISWTSCGHPSSLELSFANYLEKLQEDREEGEKRLASLCL
jgi:hypothetical protein